MKKGFTLIELLVVIAIIGILSAIVLTSLTSATAKAKRAAALSTMEGLMPELETCSGDSGYAEVGANVNTSNYVCVTTNAGTANTPVSGHTVLWPSLGSTGFVYNIVTAGDLQAGTYQYFANNGSNTITCNFNTTVCS